MGQSPAVPITDVSFRLSPNPHRPNVLASVEFTVAGCFRVKNCKVVVWENGIHRVFFPHLPLMAACLKCRKLVGHQWAFCRFCGRKQPRRPVPLRDDGRAKRSVEQCHPVGAYRAAAERVILEAYLQERGVRPRLFVPRSMAEAL